MSLAGASMQQRYSGQRTYCALPDHVIGFELSLYKDTSTLAGASMQQRHCGLDTCALLKDYPLIQKYFYDIRQLKIRRCNKQALIF